MSNQVEVVALPEGKLMHQLSFPIRWGDMDAMGHVNNIMYFRYFEQARLDWYQCLTNAALSTEPTGFVIVDNHAEYLKPLVYPAHITVSMGAHTPGRSSFITSYTICDENQLYTVGSAKAVWVDITKNKSIPLPDNIRKMLPELKPESL